jgi:hypothetical protein
MKFVDPATLHRKSGGMGHPDSFARLKFGALAGRQLIHRPERFMLLERGRDSIAAN